MKTLMAMLAAALPALVATTSAHARDPIPTASERCEVLASELAITLQDQILLVGFCEALGIEEDPGPARSPLDGDDAYFVKCEVASDPEWIGFRLITRKQCDALEGHIRP
ncbi:MAG: hypothetical protein KDE35_08085 [Geminicoccaceae bacterium]|nr:hypothetical protein [Geminicoccaceae bacterium]